MILGGRLFQLGLLLILISSVCKLFMNMAFLEMMLMAGLVSALVGTLITYTRSNKIRVEIVDTD